MTFQLTKRAHSDKQINLTNQVSHLTFILWPSIIIKRFSSADQIAKTQSVGLTHTQGIRATQYDTPVISYGCQAVTSHIAGTESSSQTLAEQDNTRSPPHQDHDRDPTLSNTHTQSAISAWTQNASKTQLSSRLCHCHCPYFDDAIVCVMCQLLCRLHCDSNHTLTRPRLAHEGKMFTLCWNRDVSCDLCESLTSWVLVSRVLVSNDDSRLYWETELSISSGRLKTSGAKDCVAPRRGVEAALFTIIIHCGFSMPES